MLQRSVEVDISVCPFDLVDNEAAQSAQVIVICFEVCGHGMHCHANLNTQLEEEAADAVGV